jgi:hypothetical protein
MKPITQEWVDKAEADFAAVANCGVVRLAIRGSLGLGTP